jgi:hypothetical protein
MNKNQAQILIDTKEILTKEEMLVVLEFSKELYLEFLFKVGENRWLNTNVYSEQEHHDYVLRTEMGF